MRRVCSLFLLSALLLGPGGSMAGEKDIFGDPLVLNDLVAYARQHNPEIRAAAARWRAAAARPSQAGSLPDPMIDVGYHNESFDRFKLGETDFAWVRIGASQELPFPGKLSLKEDIASSDGEQLREESRRIELEVISRLKMAYAEYAHLQELVDLLRRNKVLLEKLARTAEARYAVGQGIQQDVLRAHVELSLLLDRETTLEQRRQSQSAELNALLDRPPWAPLGAAEHLTVKSLRLSSEDLTALAESHAPEIRAAAAMVAGGKSAVALAKREFLPDFVLSADYMHKAALLPEWEVGLGIKVPLYFATKQRAGVEEATAALEQAEHEHANAHRDVDFRVKDLYLRARAAERLISLYSTTVIPQARLALESATTAYEVGQVDFLTLLNGFTVMLEYEMRYHEELSNFQKALAQLEAVVGEPLIEERQ